MSQVSYSDTNQGAQVGENDLDDFDAAMDELTASPDNAPANAAADDQGDPDQGSQADEAKPGSSAEEAGKVDQAAGQTPPAAQQSEDIWANAPPELREAYERDRANWNHRLSSTQGRLSVADRELARLRRESGAKPEGQSHSESGGDQQQQASNPFETDRIKLLRSEYGEVAEPILDLLEAQSRELAALKAPVAEVAQQRATEARQSEISIFTTAHPDWESYVNDQRYPEWLSQQPKAVQDAAARAVNVEDGHEAAWLLGQFKVWHGAQQEPAPRQVENPNTDNRQSLADLKRSRQLAAGRDGGASAPPAQSGMPDDFDGAMDAIIAAKARQQNRQGQFS